MNPNHESELRRRLEMTEVPPPPQGLADRIKGAIPEDAFPPKGVEHPARSRFFPLQVAASVLLLSGAAYMATRVLTTGDPAPMRTASYESKPAPVVATANEMSSSAPTVAADAQPQEQDAGATQSRLQSPPPASAPVIVADATAARRSLEAPSAPRADDARDALSSRENSTGFTSVEEVTVQSEAPAVSIAEARTSAAAADTPPPPPAAAPAPARVAVAQAAAEASGASIVGTTRERSAAKARLEAAAPARAVDEDAEPSVFGISVDESSVARVRATLDRGERPAAATVNPDAFVSYFANPQARPVNNVSLEVEGSAVPASTSPSTVLLRFSVDTATANLTGRPAARDAKIDVELNPRVIARHRRIGGESKLSASEPLLLRDVSVTAIYELELLPLAAAPQKAVTIKLRYRDPDTGREKMLSRVLHVRDFSRQWEEASRRHRLATLGGLLSESLRGTPTGVDLARRAEDLAKEAPRDERARELANVATASSRLRSSSPTGSGR